jgi:hypothetical protein
VPDGTKLPNRGLRRLIIALAIVGLVVVGAMVVVPSGDDGTRPLPARVNPLLPDLTVAPLTGIVGGLTNDGRRTVRFSVMLVNQGAGDFVLRARRSNLMADDWRVIQRVPEAGGGYTETSSDATLVYGGDGHNHWHIREVESHTIEDLDGTVLGKVVKNGFCFFDTNAVQPDLPGAAPARVYASKGCGGQIDSAVTMGLSVGWGDEYPWHLFEQEIDVTDLPEGRYRLRAVADPFGWFDELDKTNNEVVVDISWTLQDGAPLIQELGSPAP